MNNLQDQTYEKMKKGILEKKNIMYNVRFCTILKAQRKECNTSQSRALLVKYNQNK